MGGITGETGLPNVNLIDKRDDDDESVWMQQLQPNQYNIPAYKLSYIYNSSSLLNKYKCRFDSQKQL